MSNKNKAWLSSLLGASNLSTTTRDEHDYYATDPKATEYLLGIEEIPISRPVWECASGEGHIANVFTQHGYTVIQTDIIQRIPEVTVRDFLEVDMPNSFNGTIVTNPPYTYTTQFIQKALETVTEGSKVCMFLRLQCVDGKARRKIYDEYPIKTIHVSSRRMGCAKNGNFDACVPTGFAYGWFVWEKGYVGDTEIKWFN